MNLAVFIIFLALQCSATPLDLERVRREILSQSDISSNAIELNNTKPTENIIKEETLKSADSKNETQSLNDDLKENTADKVNIIKGGDSKSERTDKPTLENPFIIATPLLHGNEFKVRVLDLGNPTHIEDHHPFQVSIGSEHHQGIYIPAAVPKVEVVPFPGSFLSTESHFSLNEHQFSPYSYPVVSAPFHHFYDLPSLPVSYPAGHFSEVLGAYPSIYPIQIPQYTEYPTFGQEHHIIPVISDISQLPSATPILHPDNSFAVTGEHVDHQADSVSVEALEALLKKKTIKEAIKKVDMESNTVLNKTNDSESSNIDEKKKQ